MKSFFIVEDNPFYSNLLKLEIESLPAKVKLFSSGEDCIDSLFMNPDTILLDYYLDGELTGLDTLKKIKSFNPNINVVFLTGQGDLEVALNALRFGAFDYIEKTEESFAKIHETLGRINQLADMLNRNSVSIFSRFKRSFAN